MNPSYEDNSNRPTISNGISTKISQLHQAYSQPLTYSKQHQDELNTKLKQSKQQNAKEMDAKKEKFGKPDVIGPGSHRKGLGSSTDMVNSRFENLKGSEKIAKISHPADNVTIYNFNSAKRDKKSSAQRDSNLDKLDNKNGNLNGTQNTEEKGNKISSTGDYKKSEYVVNIEGSARKNVKECLAVARRAFKSGRTKNVEYREKQLRGLLKFLENHRTDIEEALYKDLRKHRQESNISEIELVANDLRYTLIKLKKWCQPQKQKKRFINILDEVYIYNDPFGVVLIMGAWNYPILLTMGPLIGALAGGNTIILKPSEMAPETNKLLTNVLTNYLDQECFQIFQGGVQETTELLKEKFDYIFFTGSSKVGQIIYEAAAKHLTPCTLELGGKCPIFLDNTADMHKAARRILWGRMLNTGQTCVAPDYILCTREVQEQFLIEAEKVITSFWGEDPSKSDSLSKIVGERQFRRLLNFINAEKVALGGHFNVSEYIIGPTILKDVSPHSPIMEEEIFGPILPIINIKNPQEAIDFINSREKPLALYVFSKNKKLQELFLSKTSSGGVSINDTISHISTENLPFGGVGASGMGNYHGKMGFDTFTHRKAVLKKDFSGISEMALSIRYPPYSDKKTKLINTILKRRRGVPFGFMGKLCIFALGVGITLALEFAFKLI